MHSSLIPGHVAIGEFYTGRDTYLLTASLFRRARSRISQNSPSWAGTVDLRTLDLPLRHSKPANPAAFPAVLRFGHCHVGASLMQPGLAVQLLRKLLSALDRLGCCSFLSAWA
jgi:hypothetical protein